MSVMAVKMKEKKSRVSKIKVRRLSLFSGRAELSKMARRAEARLKESGEWQTEIASREQATELAQEMVLEAG